MALLNPTGYAHARLSVRDIHRSRAFYDELFGLPVAIDMTDQVDEPGATEDPERFFGGVVYQLPSGALLGLRPVPEAEGGFSPAAVGLDHLSLAVASREELVEAARALDERGVPHGEVIDLTDAGLAILSFQDPDDINLELTAPL